MGAFHISRYSTRGCHSVLHASLSQGLAYSDLYHACHWQLADQVHFSTHMINMHRFRNGNLDQSTSAMLSDLRDLKGEVLLPSQKVGCPIWPFQWTSSLSVQPWGKSLHNCQFPQLKNIAQIPKICNYKTPFPSTQTTEQVRLDMHSHMIITTAFKNPVNKIASVLYCEFTHAEHHMFNWLMKQGNRLPAKGPVFRKESWRRGRAVAWLAIQ